MRETKSDLGVIFTELINTELIFREIVFLDRLTPVPKFINCVIKILNIFILTVWGLLIVWLIGVQGFFLKPAFDRNLASLIFMGRETFCRGSVSNFFI